MTGRLLLLNGLDEYRAVGPLLFRLFLGAVLVWGTQDNVLHAERMLEFRDFLAANGFPAPLASAYLSAYAQFICGILIVLGLLTRWAALVMIINFVVALLKVHLSLPFSATIAPLAMLLGALLLLFEGGGRWSVDEALARHFIRRGDGIRSGPSPAQSQVKVSERVR